MSCVSCTPARSPSSIKDAVRTAAATTSMRRPFAKATPPPSMAAAPVADCATHSPTSTPLA
eukprot:8180830-Pyramimonas_sp.AAC.1